MKMIEFQRINISIDSMDIAVYAEFMLYSA
jgi:hypothetical protein